MPIICLILGHKPLEVRGGVLQTLKDVLGNPLLEIVLCRRCRGIFWRFPGEAKPAQNP